MPRAFCSGDIRSLTWGWTTDTHSVVVQLDSSYFPSQTAYTPSSSQLFMGIRLTNNPRSDLVQVLKTLRCPSWHSVYFTVLCPVINTVSFRLLNYCCLPVYVTTTAWIVIFKCDYILYIWWGIDIYCNALVHTTKKGDYCDLTLCVHKVRHNKLLYDTHTSEGDRVTCCVWTSDKLCWWNSGTGYWPDGCVRELAVDNSLAWWLELSVVKVGGILPPVKVKTKGL